LIFLEENMKTIVCYGDSNTWGFIPGFQGRYDHKTRWPMVLSRILNEGAPADDPAWWVVEEGLNGRTTARDDFEAERNGLKQLLPILNSHKPLDIVVIMLGSNDLKLRFSLMPFDIAKGAQLVAIAAQASKTGPDNTSPKVLLICPPPTVEVESGDFFPTFGNCVEISKKLAPYYRQLAQECGAAFLDAGKFIKTSSTDGLHLEPEEHYKLAVTVADAVRAL
jgi:lysophospholipase L1-like esterase